MTKLPALLRALATCLSLAACGGTDADTSGGDPSGEDAGGDASGEATYRVAMICDSSISDGGWGMSCYNAMVDAAEAYGWETEVSDSIAQSAYYDTIVSYCDLGYDLIYAPGNQYTDAVLQAAEEYPDVAFALLNGGEDTPAQAVKEVGMVVEGMNALPAAIELSDRYQVDMPIVRTVNAIVNQGMSPAEAVHQLMTRDPKGELTF